MYINPFVCGIIIGAVGMAMLLIGVSIYLVKKSGKR